MPRTPLPLSLFALVLLSGCGDAGGTSPDVQDQPIATPPGVAEALSLGAQASDEGTSPYGGAVNCAAALEVTAETLAPMTSGANSREVRMVKSAARQFRNRAATQPGASEQQVAADVARRLKEKRDDASGQAQLSIACLRSVEGDV